MRALYTIFGVILILCAAGVALAQWQTSLAQGLGQSGRSENDNRSRGWRAAQALADKQESIRPIVQNGEISLAQGRYADAEALFRKALAIFPQDAESLLLLADVCERQGKDAVAIKAYNTLVYSQGWGSSINSSPNTHLRYVLALLRSHRWPEAVEVYDKAMHKSAKANGHPMFDLQFDPQSPDYARLESAAHLGVVLVPQGHAPTDAGEQLKHLQSAVRLQPGWGLAQYSYGQALEKAGRSAEAQGAYRKAAAWGEGEVKAKAEAASQKLGARQKMLGP